MYVVLFAFHRVTTQRLDIHILPVSSKLYVCICYVFAFHMSLKVHVLVCPPSTVDSFEVLRERLRSACRDAEEKEAAWRIIAAENARQRLILEEE